MAMPDDVFAFDLDISKEDSSVTGWEIVQREIHARYGAPEYPRTFMSRTPSGGYHLLYRLPPNIALSDIVHPQLPGYKTEIPIDIRYGHNGYIVAPGSVTVFGRYELIDAPVAGRLPMVTPELGGLLIRFGAIDGYGPKRRTARTPDPLAVMGRPSCRPISGEHPWRVKQSFTPGSTHRQIGTQASAIVHAYREERHSGWKMHSSPSEPKYYANTPITSSANRATYTTSSAGHAHAKESTCQRQSHPAFDECPTMNNIK